MTLVTISKSNNLTLGSNVSPFTFRTLPSVYTTVDWWTSIFGAPAESPTTVIEITGVVQDYLTTYEEVDSVADCKAQEQTYFWNSATQELFIHVLPEASTFNTWQYGRSYGYCDKQTVYVDNICFDGLLKSIPGLSQSQDITGYDKLSFMTGSIKLNNTGGQLDYLINEKLYGNDINIYYLADRSGVIDYSYSELVPIAGLYLEDYSMSLKEVSLNVQDKRKAGNIKIPVDTFEIATYPYLDDSYEGKVIPLAYGTIYASDAIPVNSNTTGTVTYRQALVLTSLGTVQVEIDDAWVTKTPTAIDLANGSFTLSSTDGRSDGDPRKCRVVGSVGILATTPGMAIKDINERFLGSKYTESNYNTAEFYDNDTGLAPIGYYTDEAVELHEVIRLIQAGSSRGFRYEINAEGKRTMRLDNWARVESFYISNEDIRDIDELEFEADSELLAATVTAQYSIDYSNDDKTLTATNTDNYDYVKSNYRLVPTMDFETLLTNSTDASGRATLESVKYKDILKVLAVTAYGAEFLPLRIYDTGTIEATQGFIDADEQTISGRAWLGVYKVQVLSVEPDLLNATNKLELLLLEKKY